MAAAEELAAVDPELAESARALAEAARLPDDVTPCEDCPEDAGDVDLSPGEAATLEALGRMIPVLEEIHVALAVERERADRLETKIDAMLAVFEQLATFFETMRSGKGGGFLGRLLGAGLSREDGNTGE
jgi:hypothetical protein